MQEKSAIIHECFEPGMRGSLVVLNQLGVQLLGGSPSVMPNIIL